MTYTNELRNIFSDMSEIFSGKKPFHFDYTVTYDDDIDPDLPRCPICHDAFVDSEDREITRFVDGKRITAHYDCFHDLYESCDECGGYHLKTEIKYSRDGDHTLCPE